MLYFLATRVSGPHPQLSDGSYSLVPQTYRPEHTFCPRKPRYCSQDPFREKEFFLYQNWMHSVAVYSSTLYTSRYTTGDRS